MILWLFQQQRYQLFPGKAIHDTQQEWAVKTGQYQQPLAAVIRSIPDPADHTAERQIS